MRPRLVRPGRGEEREEVPQGESLAPSGGIQDLDRGPVTPDGEGIEEPPAEPEGGTSTVGAAAVLPLVIAIEPSVVSVHPGRETMVQIVASGAVGAVRLPLVLSYDPTRVSLLDADVAAGARLVGLDGSADDGWLALDLELDGADELPRVIGLARFRGESPGPAPLVFTVEGAVAPDGSLLPVAVRDGVLFVVGDAGGAP